MPTASFSPSGTAGTGHLRCLCLPARHAYRPHPGEGSLLSGKQKAELGAAVYSDHNVFNALLHKGDTRSLIENVIGGAGNDEITGNVATNSLHGGAKNDTIAGVGGDDYLFGDTGFDSLDGGTGADHLYGGAQNDVLLGQSGDDILVGGRGHDFLSGGRGQDIFRFGTPLDSPNKGEDTIRVTNGTSFEAPGAGAGDRIDVSALDADTTKNGNQTFRWGGTTEKGTGFIWVTDDAESIIVRGNMDIDASRNSCSGSRRTASALPSPLPTSPARTSSSDHSRSGQPSVRIEITVSP